jgi:hypothetical protein
VVSRWIPGEREEDGEQLTKRREKGDFLMKRREKENTIVVKLK